MPKFEIMNAAGTARSVDQVQRLAKVLSLTQITAGSFTYKERPGNEGKTFDAKGLNSLGMPNGGIWQLENDLPHFSKIVRGAGKKFRLSVAGDNMAEYRALAHLARDYVDVLELNFGCPNILEEGHTDIWSFNPESIHEVVYDVHDVFPGTLALKLSPYSDPAVLKKVALMIKRTKGLGIDELVLSNTFPKGMLYNLEDGQPLIGPDGGLGGVSGGWMLPIVLGQLEQFRRVLGTQVRYTTAGGIVDPWSLAQHICAGTGGVQIGTLYYKDEDPHVFTTLFEGLLDFYPHVWEKIITKEDA